MFTSDEDKIVRASIEDIKKQFYDGLYSTKNNVTANLIRKKMPIKIGISTDPLQKIDLKYRVTYNSLKLLNEEQYPFIMITKGDLAKRDEYAELIAKTPSIYFQTITTFDKDLMSRMEPNAPTLDDRIQSLKNINDKDKQANTQIRIEPMMLGININKDGSINKEGFDELFRELKDIGVSGISTRYYCRNKIMDRQLKNEFGVDFQSEYEKTWLETLGYNEDYKSPDIPNDLIMLKTAKEFKELCDKYNFTYTPRMIKLSTFSNSKSDCCCSDRLKTEYKTIFDNGKSKISETEIYNICKEEGVVFFDDLKERGILKPDEEIEKIFNKELKRGNLYNNIDFKHILDMNGKVIGLEYIENKDDVRKDYKNIIETIRRDNHLKYKIKG
jgi:DNA repair photolyase